MDVPLETQPRRKGLIRLITSFSSTISQLANHGYIPRSGVMHANDIIEGAQKGLNMVSKMVQSVTKVSKLDFLLSLFTFSQRRALTLQPS